MRVWGMGCGEYLASMFVTGVAVANLRELLDLVKCVEPLIKDLPDGFTFKIECRRGYCFAMVLASDFLQQRIREIMQMLKEELESK